MRRTDRLDHAVVVGGSMSGLLAARALSPHAERVTLVERDARVDSAEVRKGIPQTHHAHVLLDRGRQAMERLLPGLFADLVDDGANEIDFGQQFLWYHAGGRKVNCRTPYRLFMQTRPFLDWHVRRRLLEGGNIEFLQPAEVVQPLIRDGRVRGVEVRSSSDGVTSELPCDVFVDATGRGSRSPRWLTEAGYQAPPEQSVRIDLGYASRLYQRAEGFDSDWKCIAIYGQRPEKRRHGLMLTVEQDRWLFTLMGYEGDHPPREPAAFEAFARSLDWPDLYENMQRARPLGDVAQYKIPVQKWRRYDRVSRLPGGYAVLGDAVCGFDPVFGQGMAVAALEAETLDVMLQGGAFDAMAFAKASRRIIGIPWIMASLEAHRYPIAKDTRPRGLNVLHRLLDRIFQCSNHDPEVYRALISVMHLHEGPGAFLRPSILARLARG